MPLSYITISKGEYQSLLREVQRGAEVCTEIGGLRVRLQNLALRPSVQGIAKELEKAIEACEEVSRLRVELSALERRLQEFDHDVTPINPISRTDIEAAFTNAADFANGKKKPPEKPPGGSGGPTGG